jgi:hypothetical protein
LPLRAHIRDKQQQPGGGDPAIVLAQSCGQADRDDGGEQRVNDKGGSQAHAPVRQRVEQLRAVNRYGVEHKVCGETDAADHERFAERPPMSCHGTVTGTNQQGRERQQQQGVRWSLMPVGKEAQWIDEEPDEIDIRESSRDASQ